MVAERSRQKISFDYWLGNLSDSTELPSETSAQLEVSGIRQGDSPAETVTERRQVCSRVTLKGAKVRAVDSFFV